MKYSVFKMFFLIATLSAIPGPGYASDAPEKTDDNAESEVPKETVDALREIAKSLFNNGDYHSALDAFRELFDIEGWYIDLKNIGKCAYLLNHCGLAVDYLERYRKAASNQKSLSVDDEANLEEAGEMIAECEQKIGYLEIHGQANDGVFIHNAYRTSLRQTDRLQGKIRVKLRVNEGEVPVEIKRDEQVVYDAVLNIVAGESTTIRIDEQNAGKSHEEALPKETPPAEAPALPEQMKNSFSQNMFHSASPAPPSRWRVPMWVSYGIGGATGIAAVVTGGMALSKKNKFMDDCEDDSCTEAKSDDRTTVNRLALTTDVLLAATAVAAITGTVFYFLDRRHKKETAKNPGPNAFILKDGYLVGGSF